MGVGKCFGSKPKNTAPPTPQAQTETDSANAPPKVGDDMAADSFLCLEECFSPPSVTDDVLVSPVLSLHLQRQVPNEGVTVSGADHSLCHRCTPPTSLESRGSAPTRSGTDGAQSGLNRSPVTLRRLGTSRCTLLGSRIHPFCAG